MNKMLDIAKLAAKLAGKEIKKHFNKKMIISTKNDKSFVTNVDKISEKIILKTILSEFPDHAFYSEEKGESSNDSEYCWYIDPLDGTHNFIYNIPHFAVSIGLAKGKEFILGVVYDPINDELFYARKDKGAFLNGKKISVSNRDTKDSVIAIPASFYGHKDKISNVVKAFENQTHEMRIFGSTAIGLGYLACGRIDIYIKTKITPWDTAAGKIIVKEAGGTLTRLDGSEFDTDSNKDFIASNAVNHKKLLGIVKKI